MGNKLGWKLVGSMKLVGLMTLVRLTRRRCPYELMLTSVPTVWPMGSKLGWKLVGPMKLVSKVR